MTDMDRIEGLYDRFKDRPEVRYTDEGVLLDRRAFSAFLDCRKIIETDIIPLLPELKRLQAHRATTKS